MFSMQCILTCFVLFAYLCGIVRVTALYNILSGLSVALEVRPEVELTPTTNPLFSEV
jgi:hypothetical protein